MKVFGFIIATILSSCNYLSVDKMELIIDRQSKQISLLSDSIWSYRSREFELSMRINSIQSEYLAFIRIHADCNLADVDEYYGNYERFTVKDTDGRLHKLKYLKK